MEPRNPSEAWQFWLFPAVCGVGTGWVLFEADPNGNLKPEDLRALAEKTNEGWDDECAMRLRKAGLHDQKAAYDLVAKLLEADPVERMNNFKKPGYKGMQGVLEHAFLKGDKLDDGALERIERRQEESKQRDIHMQQSLQTMGAQLVDCHGHFERSRSK